MSIGCIVMNVGTDSCAILCAQMRTTVATFLHFVSAMFIAIPLAAYFVLCHNFGLESLLFSTVAGYTTLSLCVLVLMFTSKWRKICVNVIDESNKITNLSKMDQKEAKARGDVELSVL